MTPAEQAIHDERQAKYGDFRANMAGTSQQMAGLLTQMFSTGVAKLAKDGTVTLPAWAAALFMSVALKGNRIAGGHFHGDNFDDASVYLAFVRTMQEEAK